MTRSTIIFGLFLSMLMGLGFTGCSSDDEDDLVGNWIERGAFEGFPAAMLLRSPSATRPILEQVTMAAKTSG